jgi:16S rRNA (cytosine1402-N4)-methyltransferase
MSSSKVGVHIPIMVDEVIDALQAKKGGMFLDCTFGSGGHTKAILDASPDAWVVAMDRDSRAIERGSTLAAEYGERLELVHAPFADLEAAVSFKGFDGILADLGMSTDQLKEGRGFSFVDEGALDMRMDESSGISAQEFVNTAPERDIYVALAEGGVGQNARAIARTIAQERPFESARQLADVIKSSHLGKKGESKVHPATVVFQALRMKINDEIGQLEHFLQAVPKVSKKGARFAVITFHSIEDKIVTNRMRSWESAGSYPASWRGARTEVRVGHVVNRKPIVPSDEEIRRNPASRSARLRVLEFEKDFSK